MGFKTGVHQQVAGSLVDCVNACSQCGEVALLVRSQAVKVSLRVSGVDTRSAVWHVRVDLGDLLVAFFGVTVVQVLFQLGESDLAFLHVLDQWPEFSLKEIGSLLGRAPVEQFFLKVDVPVVFYLGAGLGDGFDDTLGVDLFVLQSVDDVVCFGLKRCGPVRQRRWLAKDVPAAKSYGVSFPARLAPPANTFFILLSISLRRSNTFSDGRSVDRFTDSTGFVLFVGRIFKLLFKPLHLNTGDVFQRYKCCFSETSGVVDCKYLECRVAAELLLQAIHRLAGTGMAFDQTVQRNRAARDHSPRQHAVAQGVHGFAVDVGDVNVLACIERRLDASLGFAVG